MIKVFYTAIESLRDPSTFNLYLAKLPVKEQSKILDYIRLDNRCQRLAGRLLLLHALAESTSQTKDLSDLEYDPYGKPYFSTGFSFSISHSGNFAVLSITQDSNNILGIDIEKIKTEKPANSPSIFTENELRAHTSDPNPVYTFFKYWTIKESISKAIGTGLNFKFSDIEVVSEQEALANGKSWYLKEIEIQKDYICFLSAAEKITGLQVTSVSF